MFGFRVGESAKVAGWVFLISDSFDNQDTFRTGVVPIPEDSSTFRTRTLFRSRPLQAECNEPAMSAMSDLRWSGTRRYFLN
jgi:hypothetical protein